MTVNEFIEEHDFNDESPVLVDEGLEKAFIGLSYRFHDGPLATYDREKVIEIYMTRDGMSHEEAEEFYGAYIQDGWHGDKTPVYMIPYKREDD